MSSHRDKIHSLIHSTDARILEIGPLNRPLISKDRYPNVLYCDIRSTEEVKSLYSGDDYLEITNISIPLEEIVDVDVVLNGSYEKTFSGQPGFDYIVASHVLEHVEDLLFFLQDISKVLVKGGKLIVYYPDKRYCFDHFRSEASFRDAYDVYKKGRSALSRMVLDFFSTAINENAEIIFWNAADMQKLLPSNNKEKAMELYERSGKGEFMDDVHYWPFTDAGFLRFLHDAIRMDFIELSCEGFYPTLRNTQEFLVVLGSQNGNWDKEKELCKVKENYASVADRYYNSIVLDQGNRIEELDKQIGGYTLRIKELQQEKDGLQQERDGLQQENEQLHLEKQDFQRQADELIKKLVSQQEEHKKEIYSYEHSKSWRLTKPLRAIMRLLKR